MTTTEERHDPILLDTAQHMCGPTTASAASTPAPNTEGWWYADGETGGGPISSDEVEKLLCAGAISSSTRVWQQGRLTWQPLYQVPELARGRPAPEAVQEFSFMRSAREAARPAGPLLWWTAITLGTAIVWLDLAFNLPEKFSLPYAIGRGVGMLMIPAVAAAIASLWGNGPHWRKSLKVFIGACAVLLVTSATSTLMQRGYALRWLNKAHMSAEDFKALANTCARLGDLGCQEDNWRDFVRLQPDDAVSVARLAMVLNQRGKHEEALIHFKHALDLGVGAYDFFARLADSHEKLGHTADAIEWLYKTLSVAPTLVDIRSKLAGLLVHAQRPYEALSLLQGYDSQLEALGQHPYFTAQRISIETIIDQGSTERNTEQLVLRLPMYSGHFFAPVTLGTGKPKPFMVDTGASFTSLSDALLRDSKARYRLMDPSVRMTLADSRKVTAKGVILESMKVGPFELQNVPAMVCADCLSLLGQASLSRFDMRSVRMQGVDFLLLAQRGTP